MINGVVAIVGQPNVGKSTLFNRLIGERTSIVLDEPGVTRDRLYGISEWLTQKLRIIDTGGIVLKDELFSKEIFMQVEVAIEEADVIIFVVDGLIGLTSEDRMIAKMLHQSEKPVVVAVNKIDDAVHRDKIFEYYALGFEHVFAVSSIHAIGVGDVLDQIVADLPLKQKSAITDAVAFSIIGQPNVGKSSLVNALLNEQRVIVSEIAGTTRDAVDTPFTIDGEHFVVIDTAGIRKRGKIFEKIEKYALLRAMTAIERSHVVCFVVDTSREITELDKNVAGYAFKLNKPMLILLNKWDLVDKDHATLQKYESYIREQFAYLSFAPILSVSAERNTRIHRIIPLIKEVYENASRRINTATLNEILYEIIRITPPPTRKGKRLRITYMTQVDILPPKFLLFVNDPSLVHFSYLRYIENKLREYFEFNGTPLIIEIRAKSDGY